jgi:hypothetical protein
MTASRTARAGGCPARAPFEPTTGGIMRFVGAACLTAAGVFALVGCGGSGISKRGEVGVLDDRQQLAALVTEFADTATPASMLRYFVAGTKIGPADYKKYVAHNYKVEGKPAIDGDAATATVKVTTANDGREVGTKEWAFVKQGDKWKLKSAPLP